MSLFGKSKADDAALAARYKRMLAVAKSLASERDLKKVLTVAVDAIVEFTSAERAFVWLGSPEEGSVAVARNLDKEHVRKPAGKVSRSILARTMESGETVLSDNASEDMDFLGSASIGEMKLRSVLCTPLSLHAETIGAIYVDHRFRDAEFSEEDMALLDEFRDLASIAIGNAQLFEENQAQRKRLEELNEQLSKEVAEQNVEVAAYRRRLFPAGVPTCTIEAGSTLPWRALAGPDGLTLGIDHFGASAPAGVLAEKFGFTAATTIERVSEWLGI